MLAATFGASLFRSLVTRKWTLSLTQLLAWCSMFVGACFLCLGPAAAGRAGSTLGGNLGQIILHSARAVVGLLLCIWPVLLLIACAFLLWHCRKRLWMSLEPHLEWWLFLVASIGFFTFCGYVGVIRLSMGLSMAAFILLLRYRVHHFLARWRMLLSVIVLLWMFVGVRLQIQIGNNVYQMLADYRQSKDGVVCRPAVTLGVWSYTVSELFYGRWHTDFFRREYEKSVPMTILPPWLYRDLYLNPEIFFKSARCVDEQYQLYVSPRLPKDLIQIGCNAPTSRVASAFASAPELNSPSHSKWIPGRIGNAFPDENRFLQIPFPSYSFIVGNGCVVTIYHADTVGRPE